MPTKPAGRGPTRPTTGTGQARDRVRGGALIAAPLLGLAVLLTGLLLGGGAAPEEGPVDPGPITRWLLPIAVFGRDVGAIGTLGSLLFGVVLAPSRKGELRGAGLRAVHRAAWWALGWAMSAAVAMFLTLSDFLAIPPGGPEYMAQLGSYITTTDQGRALFIVLVLALVIAIGARWVISLNAAAFLLLVAFAGLLPPAFTGHSASAADHDIATSSLIVHVVAVAFWVGGLAAFAVYGRPATGTEVLRLAAPRYSQLAAWCLAATGISGVVNAWVRMYTVDDLWTTRYGWLLTAKIIVLVILGWLGWVHRKHTMRQLEAGRPLVFLRFAAGEVVVMATAIALGVALSRTEPPVPEEEPEIWSIGESLVGHELPPVTFERLWTMWRPDTVVLLVALLAIVTYLIGVRRMRAAHGGWPIARTLSWVGGVVVTVVVLNGGLATYGPAMFSAHMVQHMALTMLVPIMLALGAPVTLALRVLPAHRRDGNRGAREWILVILHSRLARVLTHPIVALALYVVTLYGFYFSPLFGQAMSSHVAHLVMHVHFIGVGALYFWPILGADPMPRQLPYMGRFLLLFASVPFHAFFGVIIMQARVVLGESWYRTLDLPWVDLAADQNLGGGIAWAMGEVPTVIVLVALLFAWRRADEREGKRQDRRADKGRDAELEQYNDYLAKLAHQDRARGGD